MVKFLTSVGKRHLECPAPGGHGNAVSCAAKEIGLAPGGHGIAVSLPRAEMALI